MSPPRGVFINMNLLTTHPYSISVFYLTPTKKIAFSHHLYGITKGLAPWAGFGAEPHLEGGLGDSPSMSQ
jgi:hypothetical protein